MFAGARSYVAASTSRRRRFAVLGVVGRIGVGTLLVELTPKLLGGPFVDVNPRLEGPWLDHVTELQSLFNGPSSKLVVTIVGPFLLGIVSAVLLLRRGEDMDRYALITLSWWLVAYVLLSLYEVRWAIFGHLLAVVLLVATLDRLYRQPWHGALGLIARPMTVAVLLLVMAGSGLIAPSPGSGSLSPNCPLSDVLPHLGPGQTVLAEQDIGPEILYRTEARVIATPYHRNASGILFYYDVMHEASLSKVQAELEARGVNRILVCPGSGRFGEPRESNGNFLWKTGGGSPSQFRSPDCPECVG